MKTWKSYQTRNLKKIMLKFIRDENTNREDFQNRIIAEIQQIKTKLDVRNIKLKALSTE